MSKSTRNTTKMLTTCAVLTAMAVVLARLLSVTPTETVRFSFEAVPIFLAGMLYGPLAGALVGFLSDFLGSLMSFGFNPLFCLPPILYGLCAGLFRPLLGKIAAWRIALAFLPSMLFGSILWQSAALSWVYGGEAKMAFFTLKLAERSIQFAITFVLDVLIVYLLCRSQLLKAAGLWQPQQEGGTHRDRP